MDSYLTMTPIHKSSSYDPPTTSKSCHHLLIWFFQTLSSVLIHNFICWYFSRKKSPFRSYFLFFRQHELLHGSPWWMRFTMLSLPKKVKTKRIQHYQQISNGQKYQNTWDPTHPSQWHCLPVLWSSGSRRPSALEPEKENFEKESKTMMRMIIIVNLRKRVVPVY